MAEKITVGYFLEDIAHERFIKALVERIAADRGLQSGDLIHDVRNATRGSVALREFRRFLRDCVRRREDAFDLIVVAMDGNCTGYVEKREQLLALKEQAGYGGRVVCAIPNPHIERWYMADAESCRQALRAANPPQCPAYKCEKRRYKRALVEAIRSTGVESLLGGAEFGAEIAQAMDLYRAGQVDNALGHFMDDLRDAFSVLMRR